MQTLETPAAAGLAKANGVELYYEDFGDRSAPPVVLIMGLAAQHVFWPEGIVNGLLRAGYRVIKFDNRDIGLSTKLVDRPYDPAVPAFLKSLRNKRILAPYTLFDMADDTVGLLDALGLASAHIVGASMGGMVAQLVAALHRDRTRSLTSIMSTTLHPRLPKPRLPVLLRLALTGPRSKGGRDAAITQVVETYRAINGRGFAFDAETVRERATVAYDRSYHPRGRERQLVSILATGSFEPLLSRVTAPTAVIHGDQDPLTHHEGGRATARAIPHAKLHIVKGMGHGMPEPVQADIVGWIDEAAKGSSSIR